ncbi:hypothetical protein LAZ67_18001379 [Cordylochernes scorpioides]|uniref:Uncharacterized protein n=1 Tax=Cordylochernes scorpioides TaxID=51811 RepID=A0ABY6LFN5_9ARAC|nr:hypothetical protein LAZ67_18001379 [Cordylochernes scorpioides]
MPFREQVPILAGSDYDAIVVKGQTMMEICSQGGGRAKSKRGRVQPAATKPSVPPFLNKSECRDALNSAQTGRLQNQVGGRSDRPIFLPGILPRTQPGAIPFGAGGEAGQRILLPAVEDGGVPLGRPL